MNTNDDTTELTSRTARMAAVVMVAGLLLMAMFFSSSLVTLSYDLPPGDLTEKLVAGAEYWHQLMSAMGADLPAKYLSELVEHLHSIKISSID